MYMYGLVYICVRLIFCVFWRILRFDDLCRLTRKDRHSFLAVIQSFDWLGSKHQLANKIVFMSWAYILQVLTLIFAFTVCDTHRCHFLTCLLDLNSLITAETSATGMPNTCIWLLITDRSRPFAKGLTTLRQFCRAGLASRTIGRRKTRPQISVLQCLRCGKEQNAQRIRTIATATEEL